MIVDRNKESFKEVWGAFIVFVMVDFVFVSVIALSFAQKWKLLPEDILRLFFTPYANATPLGLLAMVGGMLPFFLLLTVLSYPYENEESELITVKQGGEV